MDECRASSEGGTSARVGARGRTSGEPGGGLYLRGHATFLNTTLAGNASTAAGGGVYLESGSLRLTSSIIAQSSGANCDVNSGAVVSQGDNISDDATCVANDPVLNDRTGTNPLLGTLGSNGGFVQTIPLLAGSPAIDNVVHNPCPPPSTDARGYLRPAGARCDSSGGARSTRRSPSPSPRSSVGRC